MGRRIIPGVFLVGILSCLVLLVADTVRASRPSPRVPDVQGAWDGFFVVVDDSGLMGLVRTTITQQDFRRIAGTGMLFLDLEGSVPFNAINFRATVAQEDFITGIGSTPTGRFVFQAGLETFPGNAAVMYPQYHFVPQQTRISAILLHPFPELGPDISGTGTGYIQSRTNSNFKGPLAVTIAPEYRGSFLGQIDFSSFSWPILATTSGDNRFLMIAQGGSGRLVAFGGVIPEAGDNPMFIWGSYYYSAGPSTLLREGRIGYKSEHSFRSPPVA